MTATTSSLTPAERIVSLLRDKGSVHAASVAYILHLGNGESSALHELRALKAANIVESYQTRGCTLWRLRPQEAKP